MEQDVGLIIPILGNIDGFKQSMSAVKEQAASAMAGVRDAIGAVGIATSGYLKSALNIAAKGEQNFADLKQTIKSTGGAAGYTADQIKAMAGDISSATTYSAGQVMKGQNMLLTFTNIQGKVFEDATKSMLDLSQKMGSAPEQTAIQLGKALNDPIKGVTALTRVGVTFTEQQKEQIKAMENAGNMAGAQKVILNELNKEFGGQATAAAQTYNGQMMQMSNTMNSIKSTIGGVLLPYFLQIAKVLNEGSKQVASFIKEHKNLVTAILSTTAVFGTLIGGGGLLNKVLGFLGPTIQGLTGMMTSLLGPIGLVVGAIGLFTLAYIKNFGGFKTAVDNTLGPIIQGFKNLFNALFTGKSVTGAFWESFRGVLGENIAGKIAQVIGVVEYSIKGLLKFLKGDLAGAKNMFFYIFGEDDVKYEASAQKIVDVLSSVKTFVINVINNLKAEIPTIKNVIQNVFSGIVQVYNSVLKPVLGFIIQQFGVLVSWVVQNWPLIKETISVIMQFVSNLISDILGKIVSFWKAHGATILAVIKNDWDIIKTIVDTVIHVVLDVIQVVMNIITGHWGKAWEGIKNIVKTALSGLINVIKDILSSIGSIFADVAKTAWSWGANLINGFIDGIKSKINAAKNAVHDVIKGVKDFMGFNSPAKEGEGRNIVKWGSNMIGGFMDGVKMQLPNMRALLKTAIPNLEMPTVQGKISSISQFSNNQNAALQQGDTYIIMDKHIVGKLISEPVSRETYAYNSRIAMGKGLK